MTNKNFRQQGKLKKIAEYEQVKMEKELESQDEAMKEDNQSVKLAMAKELIEMGITKISAHRILNIRQP